MSRNVGWLKRLKRLPRGWGISLLLLVIFASATSSMILSPHLAGSHSPGSGLPLGSSSGPIIAENKVPGTTDWLISEAQAASIEIQGYASATSVGPGHILTFYVSTQHAGTAYTAEIYRLGWYNGAGGRLMAVEHERGQAQGYFDPSKQILVGCATCILDPTTRLVEAHWQPSFSLTIPMTWVTGLYETKLIDARGMVTAVPFVVLGNPHATYVVVIPDNTMQAYNTWGGYSLYQGPNGTFQTRAYKVSFDRPVIGWRFVPGGLPYLIDPIRWMEREGYDLSYMSSVALDENSGQLLNHRAYISLGHDEYWSKAMRDGVENARNQGVGLAFFGANAAYWQIRYEPDKQGVPDRTIVCYKSAKLDPLSGKDDSRVTVQWRQVPLRRPENALIGIMYISWAGIPHAFPWRLSPTASSPLLAGTGLQPGHTYGCDLVGYEWDGIYNNGATPKGLVVLGVSPVISHLQQHQVSATTYYIAPSGALVFASGSIYWGFALDDLRVWDFTNAAQVIKANPCYSQSRAIPGIQKLMEHVMAELPLNQHATPVGHMQVGAVIHPLMPSDSHSPLTCLAWRSAWGAISASALWPLAQAGAAVGPRAFAPRGPQASQELGTWHLLSPVFAPG